MPTRKYLCFITSLDDHGAQQNLLRFITRSASSHLHPIGVITLSSPNPNSNVFQSLTTLGVPVFTFSEIFTRRYISYIRSSSSARPLVLFGWMYHGSLLAFLYSLLCFVPHHVLFTIRHGEPFHQGIKIHTKIAIFTLVVITRLTNIPILFNSKRGIMSHVFIGFPRERCIYWPNLLPQSPPSRTLYHRLTNLSSPIRILYPARLHPQKNHIMALEVLKYLIESYHLDVSLTLIGDNLNAPNSPVNNPEFLDISSKVRILPATPNILQLYSAFDIVISTSSFGEGLQNIIIESILTSTPVFSTSAGDASLFLHPMFLSEICNSRHMALQIHNFIKCLSTSYDIRKTPPYNALIQQHKDLLNTCKDSTLFSTFCSSIEP